jgi:NitT/TauT family transport system substrate-binding protein
MTAPHAAGWSRRQFLGGLTLAGTAGFLAVRAAPVGAEPPPETTRLRLHKTAGICVAPQYVAEELLHAEGFTDVHYVELDPAKMVSSLYQQLAAGSLDLTMAFVPPFLIQVDAGVPLVLLGGVHVGCYEVFGTDRVRAIRDLKGKTVAVPELGGTHHLFLASMAQYVGLDPRTDIHWAVHPPAESIQRLAEGTIDALVGFPPVVAVLLLYCHGQPRVRPEAPRRHQARVARHSEGD